MGKQSNTTLRVCRCGPMPGAWRASTPCMLLLLISLLTAPNAPCQLTEAESIPLLLPGTIAFDAKGNLYLAETNRHTVDRLDPAGKLTIVAGTGTQGYSGDGALATAATLDSPQGVAVDAAGNVYIGDTHNHRVRMVASGSGLITTIAGTGSPGSSGDGGNATAAQLSTPSALALNGTGELLVADSKNHCIRSITLASGIIATVAGTGVQGEAGDGGAATAAFLDTPGGLAVDATGNLYLSDTHNRRVRRVAHDTGIITSYAGGGALLLPRGLSFDADGNLYIAETGAQRILRVAPDGTIATFAGTGAQGFAGDGSSAVAALLDSPRAVAVSPKGLLTLADTGNARIRQVDSSGLISTAGGISSRLGANALLLTVPATLPYGNGALTATINAAGASGPVNFLNVSSGLPSLIGTAALNAGTATLSTAALPAGAYRLLATYAGDAIHLSAQSGVVPLTIAPLPVTLAATPVNIVYGQAVPPLTGTLSGILPQDAGLVSIVLTTAAQSLSPPGTYPVTAALGGPSSTDYELLSAPSSIVIGQAPTASALTVANPSVPEGNASTFSAHAVSTTQGTPTGRLAFLDAGVLLGSVALDPAGTGALTLTLGNGSHPITAAYSGDTNFLPSSSLAIVEVVTPTSPIPPDFTLSASNSTSQTVAAGASASFAFSVSFQNGTLSSPILLTASGLPGGATGSFNPAYLPPGGAVSSFTFTVQTVKTAASNPRPFRTVLLPGVAVACLLAFWRRPKLRIISMTSLLPAVFAVFAFCGMCGMAGCGDRVASLAAAAPSSTLSYPITITATSTLASGAILQHAASVTLVVP